MSSRNTSNEHMNSGDMQGGDMRGETKNDGTLKLATWNVNGIRARLDTVLAWLKDSAPDIVCLQEVKIEEEKFPALAFAELGYNVAVHGQKSFNGVAILSKLPLEDVQRGLPTWNDDQARYIEAVVSTDHGALRVASVYAPNGNPVDSEKFPYKLRWMQALHEHVRNMLALEEAFALGGDYNVILTEQDAKNPDKWRGDALFHPDTRAAMRRLLHLGLSDAHHDCNAEHAFTFWDYQGGAWQKDDGIRIDYILLTPQAADWLASTRVDKRVRGWEKPSDHVPVIAELAPRLVSELVSDLDSTSA